ncbi:glycogen synthase GlgA [Thaumasiovibrio sp. DFM-14]|uniref:glycogen synthase GlgA n=1 Tax=Thaumasiovibrio sp. DFM-14 TaxID=3384792 RepID=UPI0039A22039
MTSKSSLRLLFVSSEVEGLLKTGGLADVAKSLPESLLKLGYNVKVIMPFYRQLKEREKTLVCSKVLSVKDQAYSVEYKVYHIQVGHLSVYAIDAPHYFDREAPYAVNNQAYPDNGERFAFFDAAVLDCLPEIGFQPDLIHCNDWQAGLVPFLLKTRYSHSDFYAKTKSVITIHNAIFRGEFDYSQFSLLPELTQCHYPQIESGCHSISMLRAGIAFADKVNAVSPNYAKELLTPLGAHGLHEDFLRRQHDLYGILNGCDYGSWNPESDTLIAANYGRSERELAQGKLQCKADLQRTVDLPEKDVALYGMVCRLTNQKGIQYLIPILERFLVNNVQVVLVGTGDPVLAAELREIAQRHSDKMRFVEAYDNTLAHKVEAGSDFFLMPSEFEPCGLNQIYSLAYGTLPIVRAVGGLVDTVVDYDSDPQKATGFVFTEPKALDLLCILQRSLIVYLQAPAEFTRVQQNAMAKRFEWQESAIEYIDMYSDALGFCVKTHQTDVCL